MVGLGAMGTLKSLIFEIGFVGVVLGFGVTVAEAGKTSKKTAPDFDEKQCHPVLFDGISGSWHIRNPLSPNKRYPTDKGGDSVTIKLLPPR